ncbi:hypothetical protein [Streptomyces sp. NPDC001068]|uniref:hypothetical protein n=1 Tax=Streptomyces sp. NPDC001068 TaxID=3364544 RepID=UPI0036C47CE2
MTGTQRPGWAGDEGCGPGVGAWVAGDVVCGGAGLGPWPAGGTGVLGDSGMVVAPGPAGTAGAAGPSGPSGPAAPAVGVAVGDGSAVVSVVGVVLTPPISEADEGNARGMLVAVATVAAGADPPVPVP